MEPKTLPSQAVLRGLFDYRDGTLIHKTSPSTKVRVGDPAGSITPDGYVRVGVDGEDYLAHRLIYKWHHNVEPAFIDHRNSRRSDNHIDNLRAATRRQNNIHTPPRRPGKVKGVYAYASGWRVRMRHAGKFRGVCGFSTYEDAAEFAGLMETLIHGEWQHGA